MLEEANRPILAPRRRTPIPTARRNVRQLTQYFEVNPILPLIGLFRLPFRETATTTKYQPLGQELTQDEIMELICFKAYLKMHKRSI